MTTFLELAKKRYSVRNYLDKPVEKEKLMYVLEAGRVAPSAANFQPWHFVVISMDFIYPYLCHEIFIYENKRINR